MREYFNAEEREDHIKVKSCQYYAKKLAESPAITDQERKDLLKAHPMYNMGIACELEDVADEGCPFKM